MVDLTNEIHQEDKDDPPNRCVEKRHETTCSPHFQFVLAQVIEDADIRSQPISLPSLFDPATRPRVFGRRFADASDQVLYAVLGSQMTKTLWSVTWNAKKYRRVFPSGNNWRVGWREVGWGPKMEEPRMWSYIDA